MARSDNKYNPDKRKTPKITQIKGGKLVADTIHDYLNGYKDKGQKLTEQIIIDALEHYKESVVGADVDQKTNTTTIFFRDDSVLRFQFVDEENHTDVIIKSGSKLFLPVLEISRKLN